MKKYMQFVLITIMNSTLIINVEGQVKTKIFGNGIPVEILDVVDRNSNIYNLPIPDKFEKLLANEIPNDEFLGEYKNKFAIPIITNIDYFKRATVINEEESIIYYLTLSSKKALNLSIQFSEFSLSKNAILSIFNDFELTDSITAKENNKNSIWATRIYQGNKLYIKLKIPKEENGISRLRISQVGLGYKKIGAEYFGVPGASASCNINVLCAAGNGWQDERNAVALIVSNLTEMCTGTLVMNTCNNNIPYVLTADHCLNANVQNWVFQFQTWSNTCTPNGTYREDVQFNGCQLRANNAATDFALVEMNQTPASNSGITYAGWDLTSAGATSSAGIHHPMDDLMKISLSNTTATSVPWFTGASNHWRVSFNQ